MKFITTFILIITTYCFLFAGAKNKIRFIDAVNGLNMRTRPHTKSRKVALIPQWSYVELVEEKGKEIMIQARLGKWSKILWKKKTGWVFGGFLSKYTRDFACGNHNPSINTKSLKGMIASTGYLKMGKSRVYSIEKAFDLDDKTTWAINRNEGIGEKIVFFFTKMDTIGILPGLGNIRFFKKNNRVKNAELVIYKVSSVTDNTCGPVFTFGEKIKTVPLNFKDKMELQKFNVNIVERDKGYLAVFEIKDIYRETKNNATCISTIKIFNKEDREHEKYNAITGVFSFQNNWLMMIYGRDYMKYMRIRIKIGNSFSRYASLIPDKNNIAKVRFLFSTPFFTMTKQDIKSLDKRKFKIDLVILDDKGKVVETEKLM